MLNENAQTLRKILLDLRLGDTFDKADRLLVIQVLLELVEKVAQLEDVVEKHCEAPTGRINPLP